MLVLFAFSITPKKALHDVLTNHRDRHYQQNASGDDQLTRAGFNCKCDNLVAESPFTGHDNRFELTVPRFFPDQKDAVLYNYYSTPHFFFELRGPPSVC
jgi:hypothetical protein